MAGSRRLTALSADVLRRVEPQLPVGPLIVALSGGADSAVCVWAAARSGSPVRAVHVDHGWPASPLLRSAAGEVAAQAGVDLTIVETHVPPGDSPEGRARTVRYAALTEQMKSGEFLLTGHTSDDQAETVLGNLLRGAGSTGLAGIPSRRGNIIRPMLDVTRSEVRELATLLGLPWMDDPSNRDTALRRNALRLDIIPYLETRMNPDLRATLVRMAASLDVDERMLDLGAAAVPRQIEGEETVRLPAPLLSTLPQPIAVRAVRRAIRLLSGGLPGSSTDAAAVLEVADGGSPRQLAGSIRVERRGVWVVLERERSAAKPAASRWAVPGSLSMGEWAFESWIEGTPPVAFPLAHFAEVFDADLVPDEFTVRPVQRGDRVAIVGGTKSVSEVLADAGIPGSSRRHWPVVVSGDEVVWVPGARRADSGWVGAGTRRYLWVRATVEGNP